MKVIQKSLAANILPLVPVFEFVGHENLIDAFGIELREEGAAYEPGAAGNNNHCVRLFNSIVRSATPSLRSSALMARSRGDKREEIVISMDPSLSSGASTGDQLP